MPISGRIWGLSLPGSIDPREIPCGEASPIIAWTNALKARHIIPKPRLVNCQYLTCYLQYSRSGAPLSELQYML